MRIRFFHKKPEDKEHMARAEAVLEAKQIRLDQVRMAREEHAKAMLRALDELVQPRREK